MHPYTLLACLALAATTQASPTPFINEIHYDNAGSDVDEGIEIAGAAGASLAGFSLVFYNGTSGAPYATLGLDGALPDERDGFGALFFAAGALQNGAPDGVALVDDLGDVLQFLSYEGAFVATAGAAAGLASVDIGVFEDGDTPVGWSLQLTGTGRARDDFAWAMPRASSYGAINTGQSFAVVPLPPALALFGGALVALCTRARKAQRPSTAASALTQSSNAPLAVAA